MAFLCLASTVRNSDGRRCHPFPSGNFFAGILRQPHKAQKRDGGNHSDDQKRRREIRSGQCLAVTDRERKLEDRRTECDAETERNLLKNTGKTGRLTHFRLINFSEANRVDAGKRSDRKKPPTNSTASIILIGVDARKKAGAAIIAPLMIALDIRTVRKPSRFRIVPAAAFIPIAPTANGVQTDSWLRLAGSSAAQYPATSTLAADLAMVQTLNAEGKGFFDGRSCGRLPHLRRQQRGIPMRLPHISSSTTA